MIAHCVQWQCSGLRLHHSQYRMSVQPDTGNVLNLCSFFVNESCFWGCQSPWEKFHSDFWRHSLTSKESLTHQVWQEAVNSSTQKFQGCFLTPRNLSWTPTLQFLSLLSSFFLSLPVFPPTSLPTSPLPSFLLFPPSSSSLVPPLSGLLIWTGWSVFRRWAQHSKTRTMPPSWSSVTEELTSFKHTTRPPWESECHKLLQQPSLSQKQKRVVLLCLPRYKLLDCHSWFTFPRWHGHHHKD